MPMPLELIIKKQSRTIEVMRKYNIRVTEEVEELKAEIERLKDDMRKMQSGDI